MTNVVELRVFGIVREVRTRIALVNGNGDEGHGRR